MENIEPANSEDNGSPSLEFGRSAAKKTDPQFFGVNVHRPRGDLANNLMNKVKAAGISWVRIDVSWDEIEFSKGSFDWSKSDDPIVAASSRGLQILANLHGTPKWANGGKATAVPPNSASDWSNFCRAAAIRYDGKHGLPKITTFGIWNEPDGSGLGEKGTSQDAKLKSYVDVILKPCSEAIRSVRGDARLAGPELASDPQFLSKMLARATDSLDIVTVHA